MVPEIIVISAGELYIVETDELVGIMIILLIALLITAASKAGEDEEERDSGDKEDRML